MIIYILKSIWQHFQTMPTGSKRCRISVASCIRFCDSRLQYNYISSLSGFFIYYLYNITSIIKVILKVNMNNKLS